MYILCVYYTYTFKFEHSFNMNIHLSKNIYLINIDNYTILLAIIVFMQLEHDYSHIC